MDLRQQVNGETKQERILDLEGEAHKRLVEVVERFELAAPGGFGLDADLRRDWNGFLAEEERLEANVYTPARRTIAELIGQRLGEIGAEPTGRERNEGIVRNVSERARTEMDEAAANAQEALGRVQDGVGIAIEACRRDLQAAIDEATAAASTNGKAEPTTLEQRILRALEHEQEGLESLTEQLSAVRWGTEDDLDPGSELEASDSLEEDLIALRDRAEADLELAQVGMAVQVVSHEFNATIGSLRAGLRELGLWASATPDMKPLYDDLRTSFDHLDGYLSLLTPLQRRLRRRRSRIKGRDIARFLEKLFGERLERAEAELQVSKQFDQLTFSGFRSSFYPAFVNLVDNALFWVTESPGDRWVRLDADGLDMLVSDSGPGVPTRDRKAIFEYGFSRKPGGTGAGLYIAREVLRREDYALDVEDGPTGSRFRITPTPEKSD